MLYPKTQLCLDSIFSDYYTSGTKGQIMSIFHIGCDCTDDTYLGCPPRNRDVLRTTRSNMCGAISLFPYASKDEKGCAEWCVFPF